MFFEAVLERHPVLKPVIMIKQVVDEGVPNVVVLDELFDHVFIVSFLCDLLDPLKSFPFESPKDKDVLVLVLEFLAVLLFRRAVVVDPWQILS